jgi:hypothetical protein
VLLLELECTGTTSDERDLASEAGCSLGVWLACLGRVGSVEAQRDDWPAGDSRGEVVRRRKIPDL